MLHIRTLRGRLTVWYVLAQALALTLFALLLYAALTWVLYRHHDAELAAEARRLATLLARTPAIPMPLEELLGPDRDGLRFVMLRSPDGGLIYRSPSLERLAPDIGHHEVFVHAASTAPTEPQFFTTSLPSGPARFQCVPVATTPPSYLQVGVVLGDVRSTLRTVGTVSALLIPVVLVLTYYGGLVLARRALHPTEVIEEQLQAIHAANLTKRVDVHAAGREMDRLVTSINRLLTRLQRAFEAQREFTADASHQLQTPLTIMRAGVDAALARPREAQRDTAVLTAIAKDTDDLAATVAALADLGVADQLESGPVVDLDAICQDAGEVIAALAEEKGVEFDLAVTPGVRVRGVPARLKQVVLNLGDNAVKYTPSGGRVRLSLSMADGHARLHLTDSGIGIAAGEQPRVFDRFYRAPGAPGEGRGLGLAIVKRVVEAHGGSVHMQSRTDHGTEFTVLFPLVTPDAS